jgi:hypothetical protein
MKNALFSLVVAMLTALSTGFSTSTESPTAAPAAVSHPSQPHFVLKPIPFSALHHRQVAAPRLRLADDTSGNWSGYAVPYEGGAPDTFTHVQGTWTVPTVKAGTRSGVSYSATWVGLDGYDSSTVEQTGTEQDWTGAGQQNYAWFEMYPGGSYEIEEEETVGRRQVETPAPVDAGDSISASVTYEGKGVFTLTIVNNSASHGWTYTAPASLTTSTSAARSSAEWILEAPSSSDTLPLADFGSPASLFSDCYAIGSASGPSGGEPSPIGAWTWDALQMLDPEGGESTPSALSPGPTTGTAFTAVWSAYTPPATGGHGGGRGRFGRR